MYNSPHNSNKATNTKRYETIGKMVTSMAHNVNNMVSIITGNAEIIQRHINSCPNGPVIAERIRRIYDAAMKCHTMATGVVDYATTE